MKSKSMIMVLLSIILCVFFAGCMTQDGNDSATDGVPAGASSQSTTDSTEAKKEETTEPSSTSKSTETAKTTSAANTNEAAELTYLRAKIKENKATVGVAYIEYIPDTGRIGKNTLAGDCSVSTIFKEYPFLSKCNVSLNRGNLMFAIVPASQNAVITVYKSGIDENGNTKDDKGKAILKKTAGEPIVILCNDHEAYSNVLICVKDGDKTIEIRPVISLENGRDIVLPKGCYDFTVRDIKDYKDEAYDYLCKNISEIKSGIKKGKTLRYSQEVYMYDHYTLKFELGKYDEDDNFVVSREYLIDDYYTLAFYEPKEKEKTIGWRVVGQGLSLD